MGMETTRTTTRTSPMSRRSRARSATATMPSLVFGELEAGRYELFEKGCPDHVALRVDVTGGEVTSTSWPDSA